MEKQQKWSQKLRAEIIEIYFKNGSSITSTLRCWRTRHRSVERKFVASPSIKTVHRWINEFRNGSLNNRNRTGRPKDKRLQENIENVAEHVNESSGKSLKRRSSELKISKTSIWRIMKLDLKLHPYKIQITQKLNPQDSVSRLDYARTMLEIFQNDEYKNLIFSDEAHFHLCGYVNKQNFRIWAEENPLEIHEKPLHSEKVTVWCAMTHNVIIGPYFFEGTVDGEAYRHMILNFMIPELNRQGKAIANMWFQQDGAPPHTSLETRAVLRRYFEGRLISRFGDIHWPPRSPDLTPPDFFLWGFLKSKVYQNSPQNLDQLKANITHEIRAIQARTLDTVIKNVFKRAESVIEANGGHLKDVIFRK